MVANFAGTFLMQREEGRGGRAFARHFTAQNSTCLGMMACRAFHKKALKRTLKSKTSSMLVN